jgi:hypothetical protein
MPVSEMPSLDQGRRDVANSGVNAVPQRRKTRWIRSAEYLSPRQGGLPAGKAGGRVYPSSSRSYSIQLYIHTSTTYTGIFHNTRSYFSRLSSENFKLSTF